MVSQASNSRIKEVRKAETERVANANVAAYQQLNKVRKYINKRLPRLERIFSNKTVYNAQIAKLEQYIINQYGIMFKDLESLIIDSINASGLEQRYLAELALGSQITWNKAKLYKELPKSNAYAITRKVLSEKSVLRRNKKAARLVAKSINDGLKAKKSILEIQKDLDVIYGFRDKSGRTIRSALAELKKGRFAHSRGIFYDTYRVSRTETARASAVESVNVATELQTQYNDVRLKLVEVMDSRTREQSRQMNGDISNANFEFRFPDNKLYKRDATNLPAKWSINDRSSSITIFLDDKPRNKSQFTDLADYERNVKATLYS